MTFEADTGEAATIALRTAVEAVMAEVVMKTTIVVTPAMMIVSAVRTAVVMTMVHATSIAMLPRVATSATVIVLMIAAEVMITTTGTRGVREMPLVMANLYRQGIPEIHMAAAIEPWTTVMMKGTPADRSSLANPCR